MRPFSALVFERLPVELKDIPALAFRQRHHQIFDLAPGDDLPLVDKAGIVDVRRLGVDPKVEEVHVDDLVVIPCRFELLDYLHFDAWDDVAKGVPLEAGRDRNPATDSFLLVSPTYGQNGGRENEQAGQVVVKDCLPVVLLKLGIDEGGRQL